MKLSQLVLISNIVVLALSFHRCVKPYSSIISCHTVTSGDCQVLAVWGLEMGRRGGGSKSGAVLHFAVSSMESNSFLFLRGQEGWCESGTVLFFEVDSMGSNSFNLFFHK